MSILKNTFWMRIFFILAVMVPAMGVFAQKKNFRNVPVVDTAIGHASFYADKFIGKKTASGEIFSQEKLTCAHNTYPFGSKVRVTNLKNGKNVILKVNDRLHHRNPRLVDLTRAGATKLGFNKTGIIKVKVELIRPEKENLAKNE
jgi:rare lipoprotein A